jgi:DNA-binding XRE family transcriptional regulator
MDSKLLASLLTQYQQSFHKTYAQMAQTFLVSATTIQTWEKGEMTRFNDYCRAIRILAENGFIDHDKRDSLLNDQCFLKAGLTADQIKVVQGTIDLFRIANARDK